MKLFNFGVIQTSSDWAKINKVHDTYTHAYTHEAQLVICGPKKYSLPPPER